MSKLPDEMLQQRAGQPEHPAAEGVRLGGPEQVEREKARMYLDIARVAILAINTQGEVTLINKRGCEILGYTEKEVLGKQWVENFLPQRIRKEVATVFAKLIAGEIDPVEYYQNPVLTQSGEERIINWYNTLIRDESGRIIGTLSSGEDVTEQVKTQEALEKAYEDLSRFSNDLERLVENRTEELRNKSKQLIEAERLATLGRLANKVAHDLRNPLTVIGGFARRLYDKIPDKDPNKKYLRIMIQEVRNMETRVSEIIRFERDENSCSDLNETHEGKKIIKDETESRPES